MSEKLPYEEQLDQAWDTLSLPDENMAWKDMKRRLDEDDDDKIVVPPPKTGCGIGTLLIGLLLLGGLWFLLHPEKWFTKKETETAQQTKSGTKENETEVKVEKNTNDVEDKTKVKNNENLDKATHTDISNNKLTTSDRNKEDNSRNENKNPDTKKTTNISKPLTIKNEVTIQNNDPKTKKKQANEQPLKSNKPKDVSRTQDKKIENNNDNEESVSNQKKKDAVDDIVNNNIQIKQKDSVINDTKSQQPQSISPVTDSTKNKESPPTVPLKKDSVIKNNNIVKQKDKEKKPIFFAAGLGLHQQIPVAGQEWTTYGSLGRKGILSDYIPSINFRMEKQDRWFLQTEFRYGAPQHTKQFTYEQVTVFDTASQSTIITSSMLKKTFYHQVPLTFNYYVLPNWSIGTGFQWNKFYSAVVEENVRKRRPGTNADSLISQKVVKVNPDSAGAFTKSWLQGVVQSQYQWKRFSIGARYSFGLQPYIKFTLPNQPLQQEKNNSFQIFLSYELWRSKNQ